MQDGSQCLSNPLVYGAQKAMEEDVGGIQCSCQFLNPLYSNLYFNDEEMSVYPFYSAYEPSNEVYNAC